eukprot:scaffold286198_cov55-Attheya_sp.AAC.2
MKLVSAGITRTIAILLTVLSTQCQMSQARINKNNKEQAHEKTKLEVGRLLTMIQDRELLDLTPCDTVLATTPPEQIGGVFDDIVTAAGGNLASTIMTLFADKKNFGVQVVKMCASCQEVQSLPGTDLSILDNCANFEEFKRYCGKDTYGHDIRHSGLVIYPLETITSEDGTFQNTVIKQGTLTGFFYNRPSKVSKFNAPSESFAEAKNTDIIFGFLATMANGFVSISPDYMGYGSSDSFRNYIIRDTYVTASMPLWLKAAAFLKEETESNTALADAAFYLGYSEGGYASVSMAEGLKNAIGVKPLRVLAGAGPFRMKDGTNVKATIKSADSLALNLRFSYVSILFGAAYSPANPNPKVSDTLEDQTVLSSKRMDTADQSTNVISWLAENDIDRNVVNSRIEALGLDTIDDAWDADLIQIARDAIENDRITGGNENICDGVSNKLCTVMAQNDLIETLETAEYPIDLCHSTADELVSYANVPDVNANPTYLSLLPVPPVEHTVAGNYCLGKVGIGFIVTYDASLYVIEEKHGDGGGTSPKGKKSKKSKSGKKKTCRRVGPG